MLNKPEKYESSMDSVRKCFAQILLVYSKFKLSVSYHGFLKMVAIYSDQSTSVYIINTISI